MKNCHPEILVETNAPSAKTPKLQDYFVPKNSESKFPALPKLDKVTIAVCGSAHVLPFSIVEDEAFNWAFLSGNFSKQQIAQRLVKFSDNDFPVHQSLADLLLKIPISEAAVERAFSRHKIAHNR